MTTLDELRRQRDEWADHGRECVTAAAERFDIVHDLKERLIDDPSCIEGLTEDEAGVVMCALCSIQATIEWASAKNELTRRIVEMN